MAIVSGGTSGIGRGITLTLAQAGWHVVAFGPDTRQVGSTAADGVAGTRAELAAAGLEAEVLDADVTSDADRRRILSAALALTGHLDGLVNNAAIRPRGPFQRGERGRTACRLRGRRGRAVLSESALPRRAGRQRPRSDREPWLGGGLGATRPRRVRGGQGGGPRAQPVDGLRPGAAGREGQHRRARPGPHRHGRRSVRQRARR